MSSCSIFDCIDQPCFVSAQIGGVANMTKNSRTPDSAEARIKKKQLQLVEGQKAMVEYEAGIEAMRVKTERLRALRLAHEAAEAERKSEAAVAPAKKRTRKTAAH
jgi:hypothetical protein